MDSGPSRLGRRLTPAFFQTPLQGQQGGGRLNPEISQEPVECGSSSILQVMVPSGIVHLKAGFDLSAVATPHLHLQHV